jgi:hypothetical protein
MKKIVGIMSMFALLALVSCGGQTEAEKAQVQEETQEEVNDMMDGLEAEMGTTEEAAAEESPAEEVAEEVPAEEAMEETPAEKPMKEEVEETPAEKPMK